MPSPAPFLYKAKHTTLKWSAKLGDKHVRIRLSLRTTWLGQTCVISPMNGGFANLRTRLTCPCHTMLALLGKSAHLAQDAGRGVESLCWWHNNVLMVPLVAGMMCDDSFPPNSSLLSSVHPWRSVFLNLCAPLSHYHDRDSGLQTRSPDLQPQSLSPTHSLTPE